jgi:Fe-S cluster assembly protein SufD
MTDAPIVIKHSKGERNKKSDRQLSFTPDFSKNDNLSNFREAAWKTWLEIPFPTGNEAEWRRTSLTGLQIEKMVEFKHAASDDANIPELLTKPIGDELLGGQVLFGSNKAITVDLDSDLKNKGVVFTDFRNIQQENPELFSRLLGRIVGQKTDKFVALANALVGPSVILYVPKNVAIERPFSSLFWAQGKGIVHSSHVIVYLEEGARVTFVHESSSPFDENEQSMHTGVIEVYVGPQAKLNFVELQSFGSNMWNFSHERIVVDRDGEVDWIFGALGSRLTKNHSDLNLIGQGSTGKMSGFYFAANDQHLNHDTHQNHLAPNTTSDLLFKGALLGESRSIWQGMIYVAPNASKTDGYQSNRNLILSPKARADSIPGLEILTDDIRCTHGATVGKIDQDQTFYLESRGIPRNDAEKLLVEGFFDPIMQRIPFDGVKKRFQNAIEEKMKDY